VKEFPVPEGIEFMKVNPKTGQISLDEQGILECFKEGTGPIEDNSSQLKTPLDFFESDFNLPIK
jgi:membrane carboxypeptidase/penicillin-binding protein